LLGKIDEHIYIYDERRDEYFYEEEHEHHSKGNPTLGWAFLIGGLAIHLTNIIHASIDAGEYNKRLMEELMPESRGESFSLRSPCIIERTNKTSS
jgi:hypothetical protein